MHLIPRGSRQRRFHTHRLLPSTLGRHFQLMHSVGTGTPLQDGLLQHRRHSPQTYGMNECLHVWGACACMCWTSRGCARTAVHS